MDGELVHEIVHGIEWVEYRDHVRGRTNFKLTVSDEWYVRATASEQQMLQAAIETFKMLVRDQ